jgi:hypothetical protein
VNEISRSDLIGVVTRSKRTISLEKAAYSVGDDVPLVLDLYVVLQGDKELVEHCAKISGGTPRFYADQQEHLITLRHDVPGTGIVPDHIYLSVWG